MPTARPTLTWAFGAANCAAGPALLLMVLRDLPSLPWTLDVVALGVAAGSTISGYGLLRDAAWRYHALRVAAWCGLALALAAATALVAAAAGVSRAFAAPLELTVLGSLALPYLVLYPMVELLWANAQLHRIDQLAKGAQNASSGETYSPLEADSSTL